MGPCKGKANRFPKYDFPSSGQFKRATYNYYLFTISFRVSEMIIYFGKVPMAWSPRAGYALSEYFFTGTVYKLLWSKELWLSGCMHGRRLDTRSSTMRLAAPAASSSMSQLAFPSSIPCISITQLHRNNF